MKGQILARLRLKPRLYWSDIALTLIPFLLWMGAIHTRSWVIQPRCTDQPQLCSRESIWPIDRVSLGMEDPKADEFSFDTQNISVGLGIFVPGIWNAALALTGAVTPVGALVGYGVDLVILAQTMAWNGLATEVSHLVVQRPRPFVYSDPVHRGTDSAHYTSFYSGHTSAAAAATCFLLLTLIGRGAPGLVLLASTIAAETLIFMTGYFRMLAGRHFMTDVLAAAAAGFAFALWVALRHRPKSPFV